jgi:hypothetical protein
MAAYFYPRAAADHAKYGAELRATNTLLGRAVQTWSERVSEDGAQVRLRVVLEPVRATGTNPYTLMGQPAPLAPTIVEEYAFSAANVRLLEGEHAS